MEYNTSRNGLILPEYGRNIQKMVEEAITLPTREERNNAAQTIINIMGNVHPHLRDVSDFNHKLWDHLHVMASFKLDIDSPYPIPVIDHSVRPKRIQYPNKNIRYKHFGVIIEDLIKLAVNETDAEKREQFTHSIVNQMRKSYMIWAREGANDEAIFNAIQELSQGRLIVSDDVKNSVLKKDIMPNQNTNNNTGQQNRLNYKSKKRIINKKHK
jgi:hypothetical protein